MKTTDLIPIDVLDHNIRTLCTRINAATYELLVMIREFDERAGFLPWGLADCAAWLAWRCDLSMTTAREKVRVAHALNVLPGIAAAFATGELSYAKVRELTRVADRDNEQVLLDFALRTTAARPHSTTCRCFARSTTRWYTRADSASGRITATAGSS
jgi:hypothetical protein